MSPTDHNPSLNDGFGINGTGCCLGVVALLVVEAPTKNSGLLADVVATYGSAGIAILVVIALVVVALPKKNPGLSDVVATDGTAGTALLVVVALVVAVAPKTSCRDSF